MPSRRPASPSARRSARDRCGAPFDPRPSVGLKRRKATVELIRGVNLDVSPGEKLGIVGESGSGKTLTMLSVLKLLPSQLQVLGGEVDFAGEDLLRVSAERLRQVRGGEVAMVYQDPMSSLNPLLRVVSQIEETLHAHGIQGSRAADRTRAVLGQVGLPDPGRVEGSYPHELSGGMLQRVMIAMGLSTSPRLLIADEPTTALDVTIQQQILELVETLHAETGMAVVWVTHDLGVVARLVDRVAVMYAGRIVELASTRDIFARPTHPYTAALLASLPGPSAEHRKPLRQIGGSPPDPAQLDRGLPVPVPLLLGRRALRGRGAAADRTWPRPEGRLLEGAVDVGEVTLRAEGLVKEYAGRRGRPPVRAVRDVSLELEAGRTLGVVGESGCGKSTLARLLVGLEPPTSGSVEIEGEPARAGSTGERRALARRIQLVFQDPFSSLDPRLTVERALGEVLKVHHLADRDGRGSRISGLLEMVALPARFAARYPHELSGGQAQRVAIARALAVEPRILVLDEPTSALDVSVRAEVMNLLIRLQEELQLTFVFISHDLGMVRHISDEIRVMYLGRVVEAGPYDLVLDRARHPYTRALAAAVPVPDPELEEERRDAGGERRPGGPGRARGRLPLQPTLPARRGDLLLGRPAAARARPGPRGRLPRRRPRRRAHPNLTRLAVPCGMSIW